MTTWWEFVSRAAGTTNQSEIARQVGVTPSAVSRWKLGGRVSADVVHQVAEALDVDEYHALIAAGIISSEVTEDEHLTPDLLAYAHDVIATISDLATDEDRARELWESLSDEDRQTLTSVAHGIVGLHIRDERRRSRRR